MNLPFPEDVDDWTWETIESLSNVQESQYLEFKKNLHSSANDKQAKRDFQRNLEREIIAFANAQGGFLVFGIEDDGTPAPFAPPEHEVKQSVTRLVQDANPQPRLEISNPIAVPSDKADRIAIVVKINEAKRKPVLTSDSAIYFRINDRKEPMSREQIETLFVDRDRRQQAIRQLEMEIDRFHDIVSKGDNRFRPHDKSPPEYHLLNTESLKEVLRENTHLYSDEDIQEVISRVFHELQGIEDREVQFGRAVNGFIPKHADSDGQFYASERQELKRRIDRLERELERLAERADLDVELLNEA